MRHLGHSGKVDANHAQIIAGLRKAGIAARSTAPLGSDFPDVIAALRNVTVLLEIKVPGGKLTAGQAQFLETWPGLVYAVETVEEAVLRVVEAARPSEGA